MKVVKAAAQVLNTLWQYRDLRTIYKKVSQRITDLKPASVRVEKVNRKRTCFMHL